MTAHLDLVRVVARRLARRLPPHADMSELVSAGNLGLIEAAERFDQSKATSFRDFASWRIRGAMLDALREVDTLSRDMRRLSQHLAMVSRAFEHAHGRQAEADDLAGVLGVPVADVHAAKAKLSGSTVVSYDNASMGLQHGQSPADVEPFLSRVPDERTPDPAEQATSRQVRERLEAAIEKLPKQMQLVLAMYYGEDLRLKEIAAVLGRTESRACQILGQATQRLRGLMDPDLGTA